MCDDRVFYTGADDVTSDRAPQWEVGWWKYFIFFWVFVLILCKYFKSYEERYSETVYERIVDIFVLWLYFYFNIPYKIMVIRYGKYRDVTDLV